MLFSSALFLFLFLPAVLLAYYVLPRKLRNALLFLASFVFYAWGERILSGVMLGSILANWALGIWVQRARDAGRGKGVVAIAIAFNLGVLVLFKYADWLWSIVNWSLLAAGVVDHALPSVGSVLEGDPQWASVFLTGEGLIRLPIGVSFFTFQATSYIVDIYRGDVPAERSLVDFGMYKSFFPQLIAGPIVRYRDVHVQIHERRTTRAGFAYGVRRFVIGLGKKMLIANVVAKAADGIFGVPSAELTPALAWLGIVCYSLQIYFDFSAYSDMAIGLGHMFGFTFLENFDYPYIARSITNFWRRWHISLSTWFRDYVYIPLGGNRGSSGRTYFNLLTVFFLCGLWHGASFNFVIWGLFHGVFLVLERIGLQRWLEKRPAILQHAYVLLAVMIGWVFFRADDLPQSLSYLRTMCGMQSGLPSVHSVALHFDSLLAVAMLAGFVGAMPWLPKLREWHQRVAEVRHPRLSMSLEIAGVAALALVFVSSAFELAAGSYNPFIYFRF
jgi:alginate O-acetyltransferase complex protein AlgI